MKPFELHLGDCLEVLKTLPDNSIDAVVCDPPYLISFMGKSWDSADGIAGKPDVWRECLRVLKPGGHLLAFSAARTYHRIAVAIEDAGFEIRDQVMYIFGSGFPKSHNIDNHRGKKICGCTNGTVQYTHENTSQNMRSMRRPLASKGQIPSNTQQDVLEAMQGHSSKEKCGGESGATRTACGEVKSDVHGMRGGVLSELEVAAKGEQSDVLAQMQWQDACCGVGEARSQGQGSVDGSKPSELCGEDDRCEKPSVEGRRDHLQEEGQLQERSISQGTGLAQADGTEGRLHHGASFSDGDVVRVPADSGGSGASRRSPSIEQRKRQSGAVAGQPESQAMGAWPVCGRCLLPMVPKGLGTALKPAHEPICVARKPLSGTVADNVLAFGTGAINIEACRVPTDESTIRAESLMTSKGVPGGSYGQGIPRPQTGGVTGSEGGRWPANLLHDGSAEVVALFPSQAGAAAPVRGTEPSSSTKSVYGQIDRQASNAFHGDSGSAARFFYCAKASRADRNSGYGDIPPQFTHGSTLRDAENLTERKGNFHPTVKPTDLMAYLCRLITPPNGTVLDPFMGSGSTGKACMREGFHFIGIEREAEYHAIALARIAHEHDEVTKAAEVANAPTPQLDLFADMGAA